ncbi:GL26804 [Drosophila persimilis]|uniref:GL26804 n=1 Tax=Drosophila persimilis TaxID=7234 RepID=B4H2E2_DROPE|nr:GL26804 [Drosophila persimilis]
MYFRKRLPKKHGPRLCIGKSSLDGLAFRLDVFKLSHGIGIKAVLARKKSLTPFRRHRLVPTVRATGVRPQRESALEKESTLEEMGKEPSRKPGFFELLLIVGLLILSIFSISQVAMSGEKHQQQQQHQQQQLEE